MTIMPVATDSPIPSIDYQVVDLNDINIEMTYESNKRLKVGRMEINGIGEVNFSERFMNSFLAIFGISRSTFNIFSPDEVIERIIDIGKSDRIRLSIEQHDDSIPRVLGAININKPYIESLDLWELYQKMSHHGLSYHDGIVRSEHEPSMFGGSLFDIGGDDMVRRFVMDIPIDGWGKPSAYLQITRLICVNGMIGESPAFRSSVDLGKNTTKGGKVIDNAIPTLKKFIESHNNEEGFQIMSSRLKSAAKTPASLEEFYKTYKLLTSDNIKSVHRPNGNGTSDVENALHRMIGENFMKDKGLVSLDQISYKKRSLVPVKCSVKDLIDLTSEVYTHRFNSDKPSSPARRLSSFIGQMLSDESGYDLEGDYLHHDNYRDYHLN